MQRIPIALRIKSGMKDEFRNRFQSPDARALLPQNLKGVRNFSVWSVEDLAFCYGEVSGDDAAEGRALATYLPAYLRECCDCLASPLENPMRLMYEDIGVVREDKSNIRHRVFVIRLKPGCAEEYKRRHDNLTASRNGRVNPGPDSNFTIWNAGETIFGYCEIDRTMERAPTEESREAAAAWETRMLEIMDWVTDDVDWLTGLRHEKIESVYRQST